MRQQAIGIVLPGKREKRCEKRSLSMMRLPMPEENSMVQIIRKVFSPMQKPVPAGGGPLRPE